MMSDHFVHAYDGYDGKSGQSMHPYHSAWMSHWTRKSYDAANHNCSSSSIRNKENSHATNEYQMTGKEIVSNICKPVKGLRETESGTFNFKNESLSMTSATIETGKLEFQSFPRDGKGKNGESDPPIKDCDIEELRSQIIHNLDSNMPAESPRKCYNPPLIMMAPDANRTPYRECHSGPEGVIQNTKEPVENSSVLGDSSFGISRPLQEHLSRSTNDMVQCGFDRGNGRMTLFPSLKGGAAVASREQLPYTNLHFIESKNLDYRRHSTFLVCEEKIESHSNSGRSLASYLQQNKASVFQTGPSASNKHSPAFGGEQFSKMQNFSVLRRFQNQPNLSEVTKTKMLQHGCNSLRKFPGSLQDVETMRICTTVDSLVPLSGGHPRFSKTTHSLLITKKTDLNSYNEEQTLRSSREFGGFDGNTCVDFQRVSPSFGHGQQGIKISPVGSSDSEGKENVDDVNPSGRFGNVEDVKIFGNPTDRRGKKVQDDFDLKNESSAETDTMDLDDFKEKNQLSCVNSSPSNKVLKMGLITPQLKIGSTREVRHGQHNTELPDINLELPALPSADNVDPSSSRTQSLDMETLLAHAEQLGHSESDRCLGSSAKPEPSDRWIKRLRLSAPESSTLGTKSCNIGEGSSHEIKNLSLGKILKGNMVASEPTVSKLHGKELMVVDEATTSVRYGESTSMDTTKKGTDSVTSLSWIRRWCRNPSATPQKKPETVMVCEPQSSNSAFEDLEERQCPSIAAMALMGKAMKGFQPCEFQKRGSFVVWNSSGF